MLTKIDRLITDFLDYLKSQNRSPLTIRNYKFYLGRFLEFSDEIAVEEIDREMIDKYRVWLKELTERTRLIPLKKNLGKNTINYHLIALRSFLKYLRDKGIETIEPEEVGLEETLKKKRQILSGNEMEKILAAAMTTGVENIIRLRDRAILEVLLATGLRVSELANLKRGDIKNGKILARTRGRRREIELTNQARFSVEKYLEAREDKLLALFIGHDRAARARKMKKLVPINNLTARSIQRIVKKYAGLAGTGKKITPQVLRNSLATHLLLQGDDESRVQMFLGFESITTVQRHEAP